MSEEQSSRINFDDLHKLLSELDSPILTKSLTNQFYQSNTTTSTTTTTNDKSDHITTQPSFSSPNINSIDDKDNNNVVVKEKKEEEEEEEKKEVNTFKLDLSNVESNNNHNQQQQSDSARSFTSTTSGTLSDYNGGSSVGTLTPKSPLHHMLYKEISLDQLRQVSETSPLGRPIDRYRRDDNIPRLTLQSDDEQDDDDDDEKEEEEEKVEEEIKEKSNLQPIDNNNDNNNNEEDDISDVSSVTSASESGEILVNSRSNTPSADILYKHISSLPFNQHKLNNIKLTEESNNQTIQMIAKEMDEQLKKSGIRLSSNLATSPLSSSRLPSHRVGSIRLKMQELNEEEYHLQQEFDEQERRGSLSHSNSNTSLNILDPHNQNPIKLEETINEEVGEVVVENKKQQEEIKILITEEEKQKSIKIDKLRNDVMAQLEMLEVNQDTGLSLLTPISQSLSESARRLKEQIQDLDLHLPTPSASPILINQESSTLELPPPLQVVNKKLTIVTTTTRARSDSAADRWDIGSRRSQSLNMQRVEGEFAVSRILPTVKKPNQDMEKMLIHISLVDQSHKVICVTEDFFVQDVAISFAQKLGLVQTDYFSLCEPTPDGCDRWLDPTKLIKDVGIHNLSKLVFKIRFFKQPKKLSDSKAVHLYYLQIQQSVVQGIYPCSEAMAFRLAALQFYITFGAHDKDQHVAGFIDHSTLEGFIPNERFYNISDEYIQRRLFRLHSQIKCNSVIEAKLRYLDLANKIPTFGVTSFQVHDYLRLEASSASSRQKRNICVAENGLLISRKDRHGYDFFQYKDINKWVITSRGINIQIPFNMVTPNTTESMTFDTTSNDQSKNIIDLMTGYNYFIQYEDSVKGLCQPPQVDFSVSSQFPLFQVAKPRPKSDPYRSRLELFKSIYLTLCQQYNTKHLNGLIDQIDELLDREGSFRNGLIYQNIDLSQSNIRASDISFIADALRDAYNTPFEEGEIMIENLAITILDLSNNPLLGVDVAEPLKIIFTSCLTISHLNLKNTGLTNKGLASLLSILEKRVNLDTLHIGKNRLQESGVKSILKAIKRSSITTLGLEETCILDDGCIIIQKLLKKSKSLSSLNISKNNITEIGFNIMFEGLKENENLRELYVSGNPIQHKCINQFLQWMTNNNNQLIKLAIAGTSLNPSSGVEIQKILVGNTCRLEFLDASLNNLRSQGTKSVIRGVVGNNTLRDLTLSANKMSNSGFVELCQTLETSACQLTKLSLRYCHLNSKSLIRLFKMIEINSTIRSIDLSSNRFSKLTCQGFSHALSLNNTLEEMYLIDCEIGHKEFASMLPGLQTNKSIRRLHLDENPIGNKGIILLCDVINNNHDLQVITLRKTSVHAKEALAFLQHLNTNISLLRLNLTENPILSGTRITPQIKSNLDDQLKRLARANIQI